MSETVNKGYALPTVGADFGTWGGLLNGNFDILDLNLGGVQPLSVAGSSNVTVTADQAQNMALVLSGTLTGNIDLVLPAVGGFYLVGNGSSGAFSVTALTSAGGSTGVALPQGATQLIWSDGTNVYEGAPPITGEPSWHDQTSSRALDSTYTNNQGVSIQVSVNVLVGGSNITLTFIVAGSSVVSRDQGGGTNGNVFCTVPPGATYGVIPNAATLTSWLEYY